MLTYINIKNFALIKDLELDLQPGMTVLTGETGAGKSIIIDTLVLALGGRAENSLVRLGAERCEITVIFDLTLLPKVTKWLIDHELDSDNECMIRRIINADGRSKVSINNYPCPLQLVRELGTYLVDIYGQHEHHELLKSERQRELLDAFANTQALSAKVKELYSNLNQAKKDLTNLQNISENLPGKIDFLKNQSQELDDLSLGEDELENLHQFSIAAELITSCHNAIEIASEGERGSILQQIATIKNLIEKYKNIDVKITTALELFDNATIQIQEATSELNRYLDQTEFNETRHKQVEERLSLIHNIARKHHVKPEELLSLQNQLKDHLERLKNTDKELQKIAEKVQILTAEYLLSAKELSKQREEAAQTLNKLVTEKIQTLGMVDGEFRVNFEPYSNQDFGPYGLERIDFFVNTNPGQPPNLLSKIASGGELSRISLAIQVITAEKDITPTLIFDEVDVGIGGKIAEIVGQLLSKIGTEAQVICVTHLPQVAIYANNHLFVEKLVKNKNTEIKISTLTHNERVKEIARMLGGVNITKQTLAHAEEMIASAHLSQS